ncbi:hypothetical protein Tco_0236964 [Tanacetum coccineum]
MQTLAPQLKVEANVIDSFVAVLNHKEMVNNKGMKMKHFSHRIDCMDKAKITRKRSKTGKHRHENGKACKSQKPKSKRQPWSTLIDNSREGVQDGRVKLVISKALIGSPKQGGHVEEGKHMRKLGFALESLTMKAQELHYGLPRWQSVNKPLLIGLFGLMEGDPIMEGIPWTLLAYPRISQSC